MEQDIAPEVEKLLLNLHPDGPYPARKSAAEQLGALDTSTPRVVEALLVAGRTDPNRQVRSTARRSLQAAVHQEILLAHPELSASAGEATSNRSRPPLSADGAKPVQIEAKGFGVRAVAFAIDSLAFFVTDAAMGFLGGVVLGYALALAGRQYQIAEQSSWLLNFAVSQATFILYFILFEWLYGASLGKLLFDMRVIREDGRPCSVKSALIRGLLRYIDGLLFGLPAYRRMKSPLYQRFGDEKAQTVVVSSAEPFIRQPRAWWWLLAATGLYLTMATAAAIVRAAFVLR